MHACLCVCVCVSVCVKEDERWAGEERERDAVSIKTVNVYIMY